MYAVQSTQQIRGKGDNSAEVKDKTISCKLCRVHNRYLARGDKSFTLGNKYVRIMAKGEKSFT